MELEIHGKDGKSTGKKAKLNDAVFAIEPNDHAIWLDVKQHLANKRQGTSKTLEKSEMSGSTRKLHRQKGTGGSRKGSIKSPLFKGGARVFGPKPRDYHFKLNKKVKDLARRSALTYKAKDGTLKVIDTVSMSAPKTSEFAALLKAFELSARKSILVVPSKDDNIVLSARNLQNTRVVVASELNTYDIMNAKGLLIVKDAIAPLETILTK
ncbi:MAG TPA: 50S ribosomal protein L4 [Flavobacteriales bacterium]|jgi:large subunit ribosomal protein L4|nr:50S ribosomal protein L4 [Flavobacteriales bacterium]MBK7102000.1 50S ribosomal protein L4 [Flavobacteriales bacterium]MBK7114351.1 50S ribosomal protein L4 [Flavobacteriales bacterium]MBK7483588.1 50S ribosomal protein L4 [Flavobacteriales bacterium]MBK7620965.1 50S ribosomal protein L4 [Flavobacteriales bacterium]